MKFLHDPRLPLLELQDTIAHLAGRLPPTMERELRAQAKLYAGQITSVMANFPSSQILCLVDNHMARLKRAQLNSTDAANAEVVKFQQTVERLVDMAQRYRQGLRGHTIHVLSQLLLGYVVVERHFQHGQYDKCTRQLLARCNYPGIWTSDPPYSNSCGEGIDLGPDYENDCLEETYPIVPESLPCALQNLVQPKTISDIVAVIFSHRQLTTKNSMLVRLIGLLTERRELCASCDLKLILKALAELGATGSSKVALSARQLLISMQTPSYEIRRNQVESIFLSAVDTFGHQFHPELLYKLITSETVVFDILSDFFYHPNPTVASVALEVYIRRSYTAYELTSVQHIQLPNGAPFVAFRFVLPMAQSLRSLQSASHESAHYHALVNRTTDKQEAGCTSLAPTNTNMNHEQSSLATVAASLNDHHLISNRPDGEQKSTSMHSRTVSSVDANLSTTGSVGTIADMRTLVNGDTIRPVGDRMGGMAAFQSLEQFEQCFDEVIALFVAACTEAKTIQSSLSEPSLFNFGRVSLTESDSRIVADPCRTGTRFPPLVTFQDPPYHTVLFGKSKSNPAEEPIHTLNVALQHSSDWSDTNTPSVDGTLFHHQHQHHNRHQTLTERASDNCLKQNLSPSNGQQSTAGATVGLRARNETDDVAQLEAFCARHTDQLLSVGIRRITFLIIKTREFPKCYTFRARDKYREDRVYRHLEPALAFQLELNRMRNYELEQLPCLNRRMHLYLAKSKTLIGRTTIDYRFFVRCIIRHADLLSREASFEFLQSEAERTLLEAMDALELAHTHPDAGYTMGNHIFLNFAPILLLEDINHLKSTIRKTVLRYARRFIRLRVSHAEVKLHIRFQPSEPVVSVRIFLHDEEGYNLGLDVYREVLHPNTGEVLLWSMSSPRGPLHGHHAALPHENKDHLQLKRFQARKFNTTYVYDYPKLLEQALHGFWRNYLPPDDHLCDPNAGLKPTAVVAAAAAAAAQVAADRAVKPGESISNSCLSGMRVSYASTSSTATLTGLGTNLAHDEVVLSSTELALDKNNQLRPVSRTPGSNTIGMVVWHMLLRTPDTPTGREVIVIANDATHKAGSFGPAEDLTFHRASQLARYLGLPRIYLASNTGARIRVADEVKSVFRVAWLDPAHPEKGYAYLYLTPDDYQRLNAMEAVNCEPIEEYGEVRYKIVDIVGKDHDMSVENLRGSAMIAGETSIAYDDIFTITIVTNRAIGIGAYLARLGQRIIQVKNSHIILTGAMALNKLLGREVYTSNSQLGGVQVMANNGVSHLVASDELLALQQTLEWLSYVPARRDLPVPVLYRPVPVRRNLTGEPPPSDYVVVSAGGNTVGFGASGGFAGVNKELTDQLSFDPIDRLVDYVPSRDRPNDDPRWLFTGVLASQINQISDPPQKSASSSPSSTSSTTVRPTQVSFGYEDLTKTGDHWLSGFFDWGTWRETLTTWAAGVVVGRARLGGIPCGAITAETRSVTCRVPADPANLSTEAQVVNQAGQVWYPDSAYKTAQAIADFARERVPLFIFASWRGFSGGMKDMYDQVLKFGSMIIDALRRYPEPVFVYLPPQSQLRGGAWVVVDPAINPDRMEMYADPIACRAGVLEPEGTVEIKYRKPDLIETMHRVDEQCNRLLAEIDQLQTGRPIPSTDQTSSDASLSMNERIHQLQMALEARQKELRPYYHQVACTFADLHDTPGRLQSRGLVHGLVEWPKSRTFFYARLRRRLLEMHAIRLINSTTCGTPMDDVMTMPISTHLVEYLSHLTRIPARPIRARTASEATEDEASSRWVQQHQWNGDTTPDQMKSGGDPDTPSSPTRSCTENVGKSERCDSVDPSNQYPSADEIACGVPKIGVQYSSGFARDLAILRQWFIQAHTSVGRVGTEEASVPNGSSTKISGDLSDAKNSLSTSATTKKGRKSSRPKPHRSLATRSPKNGDPVRTDLISGGSVSISPEAAERAWSDDHMGVGAWLAQQLGCTQFYHVPKLADLVKKEGPTNTNAVTDDENLVDETSVVPEKAPVTFIGAQIEALKRKHMFERFQSTLSASTDKTKELVTMLHQILSPTECAHLVQLLTATTTAITHDHGVG
ncbi:Acetyl-CoA carboxylase 2 [Fasciola gigantica]|uniref:Acetyl-CoA carboxylase 2 n=1 Tax=Fasciola gigantica TaxID=46835 RepID=A0A504YTI1_FASGI|nr:Acetyl-CoA carboxylase 2 [Fasciola gigantica]